MAIESKNVVVGAHSYVIRQLDARTGQRVMVRVFKRLVAPALAAVVKAAEIPDGQKFSLQSLPASALAAGVQELADHLTDEDFDFVADALAKSTDLIGENGKSTVLANVYGLHFAGKYEDLLQWLWAALEVNFSGFFVYLKPRPPAEGATAAQA